MPAVCMYMSYVFCFVHDCMNVYWPYPCINQNLTFIPTYYVSPMKQNYPTHLTRYYHNIAVSCIACVEDLLY